MLRLVMEIDGVAMDKSPMKVVEEYVLSPKLERVEEKPKGLPINYKHQEILLGEPIITVRILEGTQL